MSRFGDLNEEFYVSKRNRACRPFLEASFNRWEIRALAKKRKKRAKQKNIVDDKRAKARVSSSSI